MQDKTIEAYKERAARAAKRWLVVRQVGVWVAIAAAIAGVMVGAYLAPVQEGGTGFASFLGGMVLFAAEWIVYIALVLVAEVILKRVVEHPWIDRTGAILEMGVVRDRVGTDGERPNDAIACAIQLLSGWLWRGIFLIALIVFSIGH